MLNASCSTESENRLELKLFGGLAIKANGIPCTIGNKRSKRVLMLIEYMVANRFVNTSIQQFSDILWRDSADEDEIDNPAGALKNLVWRSRNVLKKSLSGVFTDELIMFTGDSYHFNQSESYVVDVEEFESTYKALCSSKIDISKRIVLLEKMVALYSGDFLPGCSEQEWVVLRSAYYKRIYVECVNQLLTINLNNELFEKVVALCEAALKLEQYNESIHAAYIKALAETNCYC